MNRCVVFCFRNKFFGGRIKLELGEFFEKYYKPLTDKSLEKRIYSEQGTRKRNNYMRDFSRILYSSSFRRLQGKMQLLGVQKDEFYRNRLTHSLEVSQIARGIAEVIRESSECEGFYNEEDRKSVV